MKTVVNTGMVWCVLHASV